MVIAEFLYATLVLFYFKCLRDPEPIEKTFGNFRHPLLLIGLFFATPPYYWSVLGINLNTARLSVQS